MSRKARGLETLVALEYPGQFIILGRDETDRYNVVVYGDTCHPQLPQMKRTILPMRRDAVGCCEWSEKNRLSHMYPIIAQREQHVVVGNGGQTLTMYSTLANFEGQVKKDIGDIFPLSFRPSSFEYIRDEGMVRLDSFKTDAPHYTPRISGCMGLTHAGLHTFYRDQDDFTDEYFKTFRLQKGLGKLLPTYSGESAHPTSSYEGPLLDVRLTGNATEITNAIWRALNPKGVNPDMRVGVITVFYIRESMRALYIGMRNRHEVI